uniref:Basic leucine zipper and W2 domain-containing protein 1 n=1 Tax=Nicotiana tabacum TaxID=4097 RepID=A0A1S4DE38_TOBAC|nr:PREDICTED: basic leucine zipper and W2 domain-containing protein 1-like [Nicotiana tabacum]
MSSKEKPTLGGTRIKTRKRNIAAPLDPAAFADAVVQIYLDNAGDLELVAKNLESSDLNFSRYGDTFFEVKYKHIRLYSYRNFATSVLKVRIDRISLSYAVLSCRNLLQLSMLFLCLMVYGLSYFSNAGLLPLVEYNDKKIFEVKLKEMKSALTTQLAEEAAISEVIETVKQHVKDAKLPDIEVVRILWDVLMDAIQWSGKNQQQNANSALRQVKKWAELLNTFCTSGKLELELMYKVQVQCYEDAKLMKLFPEIVRSLYDQDVLAEDTILHWFRKGTNLKGRQNFVKSLEPFVKWLEEAEEEE